MMITLCCGEVWETRRVFQGAVGNAKRFPWPRRLSAAVGSEPELRPPFVSKSLTRSEMDCKPVERDNPTFHAKPHKKAMQHIQHQ